MQTRTQVRDSTMPLLIEPWPDGSGSVPALVSWLTGKRGELDQQLLRSGAVLLRGCGISSADAFHEVVAAISPRLLDYVGGDSPRTALGNRIYTSTEFPPQLEIGLHNELSYTRSWPERVFFCCLVAPASGGETHIADGRSVTAHMDPTVRHRFSKLGVIYRQHLRDEDRRGPGKSWQETFDTDEKREAERVCSEQGMAYRWTGRGFHTTLRNPGVLTHPVTGETCWFNQADLWHARFDTVKAQEDQTPSRALADEAFGCHAYYGDGSEIPLADLEAVRTAYRKCEVLFPWRPGDLLMLDNRLAMHGRKPFKGDRKVLVAMA